MIAMAIACNPKLLIADEPTTALDVTIQAQILDLLLDLQRERGMALILITHDMGVIAETVDRVVVQYAGQQVEAQRGRRPVRRRHAPLHGGPARRPAGALGGAAAADHPGRGAGRARPADRLPVHPALPLRHRPLPRGSSPTFGRAARPGALPLPADRGVPEGHPGQAGRAA